MSSNNSYANTLSKHFHDHSNLLSEENLKHFKQEKKASPNLRIACSQFSEDEKPLKMGHKLAQKWFQLFQDKASHISIENLTNAVCAFRKYYPISESDCVIRTTVLCEDNQLVMIPVVLLLMNKKMRKIIDLTSTDQYIRWPHYSALVVSAFSKYLLEPQTICKDISTLERAVKLFDLGIRIKDPSLTNLCLHRLYLLYSSKECSKNVKYLYQAATEIDVANRATREKEFQKAQLHFSNALALRPSDALSRLAYSKLDFKSRKFQTASRGFEDAAHYAPNDPELSSYRSKAILKHAKALYEELEVLAKEVLTQKKKIIAQEYVRDSIENWFANSKRNIERSDNLQHLSELIGNFFNQLEKSTVLEELDLFRNFVQTLAKDQKKILIEKGLLLSKTLESTTKNQLLEAELYFESGQLELAKSCLQSIFELHERKSQRLSPQDQLTLFYLRGRTLFELHHMEAALEAFLQVFLIQEEYKLEALDQDILDISSTHLFRIQPLFLDKQLEKKPMDAEANYRKGVRLFQEEKWELAQKHLTIANYDDAESYFMIGYTHLQLSTGKELPYFERAFLFANEDRLSIDGYIQIALYMDKKKILQELKKFINFFMQLSSEIIVSLTEEQKKNIGRLLRNSAEENAKVKAEEFDPQEDLLSPRMRRMSGTSFRAVMTLIESVDSDSKLSINDKKEKLNQARMLLQESEGSMPTFQRAKLQLQLKNKASQIKAYEDGLDLSRKGLLEVENGKISIQSRQKKISELEPLIISLNSSKLNTQLNHTKSHLKKIENLLISNQDLFEKCQNKENLLSIQSSIETTLLFFPEEVQFYELLGKVYFKLNKYELAQGSFEKVYPFTEKKFEIAKLIAETYVVLGNLMKAREWYLEALNSDKDNADIRRGLIHLLMRLDKMNEAHQQLEELIKVVPNDLETLQALGVIHYGNKEYAQAKTYFEKTLSIDPTITLTHCFLGHLYQAQGLIEKAQSAFERALEVMEEDPVSEDELIKIGENALLRQDLNHINTIFDLLQPQSKNELQEFNDDRIQLLTALATTILENEGDKSECHYFMGLISKNPRDHYAKALEFLSLKPSQQADIADYACEDESLRNPLIKILNQYQQPDIQALDPDLCKRFEKLILASKNMPLRMKWINALKKTSSNEITKK